MERVNRILRDPAFKEILDRIGELEADRIFCGHGLGHCMDVARIAQILNLEEGVGIEKELVYACGLVHDVGRSVEDRGGVPHAQAGVGVARALLERAGFLEEERKEILEAVAQHGNPEAAGRKDLSGLLYRADKLSRQCHLCRAARECDWPEGKKQKEWRV
ncbi:HD domain-containing protein [Anaerotalea alkaliphila]|uniref:HD domain-containing protein n=1 Tax=Anaerotalea alkaliphila TaxID=2662126 RepID=A0A7X5HTU7_9FIRM|nr:HD domain-containing protein [Anaerotalea alkaliphila]NDL66546.1 HD domain-containing protein [Anaerotalea alkaliphila]